MIDEKLAQWFDNLSPLQKTMFMQDVSDSIRESEIIFTYKPQGNLVGAYESRDKQLLIEGPAGTGKSMMSLAKLHRYCITYEGIRCLIVRKFRSDLTETGLVTLEEDILKPHGYAQLTAGSRKFRSSYDYPNGSTIVVGGLDQKGSDGSPKFMSGQYDIIFVIEATEMTRGDRDKLLTRLRNYKMPFQQLLMDCNPSGENHWLKLEVDADNLETVKSTHKDNPKLYDEDKEEWTHEGSDYLDTLSKLSGSNRDRLLLGKWSSPEGIVFDNFTSENIVNWDPDPFIPIAIGGDDGYYPDPRALLFIQKTDDYILVFDEIFHKRHLAETCVNEVIELCKEGWTINPQAMEDFEARGELDKLKYDKRLKEYKLKESWQIPELAVVGSESKELQKRFRLANIACRGGTHTPITTGIDLMRWHIRDDDGKCRLYVHKRCKNLLSEIQEGYRYPDGSSRRKADQPVDENNHGTDSCRYYLFKKGFKK